MRFWKQRDDSYAANLFSDECADTITQLLEANGFGFTVRCLKEGYPELVLDSRTAVESFIELYRTVSKNLNTVGSPYIE